jgi:hypothetical protein
MFAPHFLCDAGYLCPKIRFGSRLHGMRTRQNLRAPPVDQTGGKGRNMDQKLSGVDFDEGFFEAVCIAVFEYPVEFGFFERIVGVGGEGVLWAKVAQGGLGRGFSHKKASRVVKHREAMVLIKMK